MRCACRRARQRGGPARARNAAARVAEGDVLFFVDADVTVPADTVARVVAALDGHPDHAAIVGSYDDAPGAPNFLSRYKNLAHRFVHQTAHEEACTFWSACGAVRRDAFVRVGGYDERYRRSSIEDIEFGSRLIASGERIRMVKSLAVKHLKRWTPAGLVRSEIFNRAMPWTRVILASGRMPDDLNLKWSGRVAVASACGLGAALIASPWFASARFAAVAFAAVEVAVDLPLATFLQRARGPVFAARALAWQWVYYVCAAAGFGMGLAMHVLAAAGRCRHRLRRAPDSGAGRPGVAVTAAGRVVVAGAGPAGLAAARDLSAAGVEVIVLEQAAQVGGLARTERHRGCRFDIGGHRFLTRMPEVQRLWEDTLGDEFVKVQRLSRIYYRGRFFDYPVNLANVVRNLGPVRERPHRRQLPRRPHPPIAGGADVRRLGDEPVRPPPLRDVLQDLHREGVGHAVLGDRRGLGRTTHSRPDAADGGRRRDRAAQPRGVAAREFHYPRLGPGQMWERFADLIVAAGGVVRVGTALTRLHHDGRRVDRVEVGNGRTESVEAGHVISSLSLGALLERLDPLPPPDVLAAGRALRHRDFILVGLILDAPVTFPDTWLYVHGREVLVGRVQNFRNWSGAMVPDARRTSLGMEYFCSVGDALWSRTDAELLDLAARELQGLGLAPGARVEDGCVIRQEKAYPVYDASYRTHVETIRGYLSRFENLQTIGRNGTHRYNNQDHAMQAGRLAARNVLGERHDVWSVNGEASYLEDQAAGG